MFIYGNFGHELTISVSIDHKLSKFLSHHRVKVNRL